MDPPNSNLAYDFLDNDADLPFQTPSARPSSTPLFPAPLKSPTPSPSPANLGFNPDDFLVSPPNSLTPELKRRLFPPADPLSSAPPSIKKTPAPLPAPTLTLFPDSPKPAPAPPRLPTKCNCKASRCLKLYCPCFASSGFCSGTCTCKNCQNTRATPSAVQEARETVLARDPRAFEPKVKNTSTARDNIHTKGCNCRKGCSKNYCVCRELRVACGPRCTCSGPNGCQNGKTDAAVDESVRGKAKALARVANIGPPPPRFRTDLPSGKFSRMRGRKRGGLSPFPTIDVDVSPVMTGDIDQFRQVMSDDTFMTPFTLRRTPNEPTDGIISSVPLPGRPAEGVKRRISLDEGGPSEQKGSKRIRVDSNAKPVKVAGHGDETTPIQTDRVDVKFVSSPTTGGKPIEMWGSAVYGRQDKIEVCRLPRILRVKMGSGKPLRKLDM